MIISKDSLGYVINNIDLLDLERHLKLLECFLEEYDVLLFAHFEQNIKSFIENLSQADKDFYYEGFCFGYIELYNQSTKIKIQEKIKELIFSKHYNSIFENCTESAKDRILSKIMNNDFAELDEYAIQQIKDVVCFEMLDEKDLDVEKFVNDRVVFINKNSVFQDNLAEKCDNLDRIIWYRIDDSDELKKAIEIEKFYEFIVLDKNCKFDDYSYAVSFIETASDYTLSIQERKTGEFMKKVFPKILKMFPNVVLQ